MAYANALRLAPRCMCKSAKIGAMNEEPTYQKLHPTQIFTRVVSVLVTGVGASVCAYSLTMQVQDIGNFMVSVCWFAGLFAVVLGLAGYAVTCNKKKYKSYLAPAIAVGLLLAVACLILEKLYLYVQSAILAALIAIAVQAVVLIVNHEIIKRQDPYAL